MSGGLIVLVVLGYISVIFCVCYVADACVTIAKIKKGIYLDPEDYDPDKDNDVY